MFSFLSKPGIQQECMSSSSFPGKIPAMRSPHLHGGCAASHTVQHTKHHHVCTTIFGTQQEQGILVRPLLGALHCWWRHMHWILMSCWHLDALPTCRGAALPGHPQVNGTHILHVESTPIGQMIF